jgi:3-hydroxyisobutyrate dehydrogenase
MNNGLLAVNLLAASEALASLAARGIDPAVAASAIAKSSGRSWVMQQRVPDHILPGTFDYGFSLELLAKDAATAAATLSPGVRAADSILQLASDRCAEALKQLPEGADHTELAKLSEALAGALIRARE